MISVREALQLVCDATSVLGAERLTLPGALGRVAAEDVVSGRAVPAAPNSAMDGYAVRHADVARAPARLRIVAVEPAGSVVSEAVTAGTAVKLFTGSVVPEGADTVVRREDTEERDGEVVVQVAPARGANIRGTGEDIRPGQVVVAAGSVLGPADLGVLASVGLLTSGGVSVGDLDFVKEELAAVGVERLFWKVAQKPGKPLVFGRHAHGLVFGLPGNAVSALVCFYVYVRPALRRLQGHRRLHLPVVEATLVAAVRKTAGLTEFLRVRLDDGADGPIATALPSQSSGVLTSLGGGASLLVAPAERSELAAGVRYPVIVLSEATLARAAPSL
ncbi:MAG: molybdopterin molybdotransferase MoeA [Deltaproteobacteria bacterium]|nr:MAG: molybdopterin molybdotransferase MoeA [Deltaproteobacteria bacterium]